jgi:hypothetical protein
MIQNIAQVSAPGDRSKEQKWDHEVDLLVVGAGAAGMTAALVAATKGCQALVCEKSAHVGGTTARSSGGIWIPANHLTAAAGKPDSLPNAKEYLTALLGDDDVTGLRATYLTVGAEAIQYLEQNSDVRFLPMAANPDYRELPGAAFGGRPVASEPFDGRKLGKDFSLVAPPLPTLVALGGMMIARTDVPHLLHPLRSLASFKHAAGLVGRYLVDRLSHSRGTRLLMGNALAARLLFSLRQKNVPIWLESPVQELIREGGTVVGAVVQKAGRAHRVRARRGVVLASGGFGKSSQWRSRLLNAQEQTAHSLAFEANTGDGLTMAEAAGGLVERNDLTSGAVWAPVSKLRDRRGGVSVFPHFFMDRPKPGIIAVDRLGNRFVNEASSYHDFVAGMLADPTITSDSPAFLISDRLTLSKYGMGLVLPGLRNLRSHLRSGYVTEADSIAALAKKLRIDAEQLALTIERNNQFAQSGVDSDFGKGSTAFNRFHGDAQHEPNACIGTISSGPFYAIEIWPADLATHAGIQANRNCQVIDAHGATIEGLYACGNDLHSIWRGEAPGPGVTLGPAIVFGYVAAIHAATSGAETAKTQCSADTPITSSIEPAEMIH